MKASPQAMRDLSESKLADNLGAAILFFPLGKARLSQTHATDPTVISTPQPAFQKGLWVVSCTTIQLALLCVLCC